MNRPRSGERRFELREKCHNGRVQREIRYSEDVEYISDSEESRMRNWIPGKPSKDRHSLPRVNNVGQNRGMNLQQLYNDFAPYHTPSRPYSSGVSLSTEESTARWSRNNREWTIKPTSERSHTLLDDDISWRNQRNSNGSHGYSSSRGNQRNSNGSHGYSSSRTIKPTSERSHTLLDDDISWRNQRYSDGSDEYFSSREMSERWSITLPDLSNQRNRIGSDEFFFRRHVLDVDIKCQHGKGAYGTLFVGLRRGEVEVKVAVRKIDFHRSSDFREFFKNVSTMTRLSHPNLLKVMGICEVDGRHCLVSEFMKDGSLGSYLRRVKIDASSRFAKQIASGMAYLHKNHLRHWDLRVDNVLINTFTLDVKVADFSLARFTKQGSRLEWLAPEVKRENIYPKSDVWSFGILLYEIKENGKTPRHDIACMKKPHHWSEQYFHIMNACLRRNHHERPSFTELLGMFGGWQPTGMAVLKGEKLRVPILSRYPQRR